MSKKGKNISIADVRLVLNLTKIHLACKNKADRLEYNKMLKQHHFEVKHWRALETSLQFKARSSPEAVTVLSYDDTSRHGISKNDESPNQKHAQ